MKTKTLVVVSIILGVVIALLTGLYNSTPNIVGATWYGLPLAWMYNYVTYPPSTGYSYVNLVIDIIVWFIVVLVIGLIYKRIRK
jgi:hypothetical protein